MRYAMNGSMLFAIATVATFGPAANGQRSTIPPVRQVGRRVAISADTLGAVSGIRQLSDGRVLINDVHNGRLLLYDSSLSHATVVADSSITTKRAYGSSSGGIIPYLGDTTLFVDGASLSLLVVDPDGQIVRVMSAPRPQDVGSLALPMGGAALDARGGLVYRATGARLTRTMRDGAFGTTRYGPPDTVSTRDSSYIVRAEIVSRQVDTVGFITLPRRTGAAMTGEGPDGYPKYRTLVDPILIYDEWAVLSDGSVAIVRGRDYHIDWITADGTPGKPTTIAHEWHRLSDSEKTAIVDSTRRVVDSTVAAQRWADSLAVAAGKMRPRQGTWVTDVVDPSDLLDYRAPFVGRTLGKLCTA